MLGIVGVGRLPLGHGARGVLHHLMRAPGERKQHTRGQRETRGATRSIRPHPANVGPPVRRCAPGFVAKSLILNEFRGCGRARGAYVLERMGKIGLIAFVAIAAILGVSCVGSYNKLVSLDQAVAGAVGPGRERLPAPRRPGAQPGRDREGRGQVREGDASTAVTEARAKVGQVAAGDAVANDPAAVQRVPAGAGPAVVGAVAPAGGGREVPRAQGDAELPRSAGAARGDREPDRRRAHALQQAAQAFNTPRNSFPTILVARHVRQPVRREGVLQGAGGRRRPRRKSSSEEAEVVMRRAVGAPGRVAAVAVAVALAAALAGSARAADGAIPAAPTRYVTDRAGFLSPAAAAALEQRLGAYERRHRPPVCGLHRSHDRRRADRGLGGARVRGLARRAQGDRRRAGAVRVQRRSQGAHRGRLRAGGSRPRRASPARIINDRDRAAHPRRRPRRRRASRRRRADGGRRRTARGQGAAPRAVAKPQLVLGGSWRCSFILGVPGDAPEPRLAAAADMRRRGGGGGVAAAASAAAASVGGGGGGFSAGRRPFGRRGRVGVLVSGGAARWCTASTSAGRRGRRSAPPSSAPRARSGSRSRASVSGATCAAPPRAVRSAAHGPDARGATAC